MLVLSSGLCAFTQGPATRVLWLLPLAAAAAAASLRPQGRIGTLLRLLETAVCCLAIANTGQTGSPVYPYLIAPAFAAGLATRLEGGLIIPAAATVGLVVGRLLGSVGSLHGYAAESVEWVLLAAAAGILAAWARSISQPDEPSAYLAAYRLLSQLRAVTRRLPGGLDPVTLGKSLLGSLHDVSPHERAIVLVHTEGSRLVPLVHTGSGDRFWNVTLEDDSSFADAWASQQPQLSNRLASRAGTGSRAGTLLVLPLRVGVRSVGLVGLESSMVNAYSATTIRRMLSVSDDYALRLETALLFDEVRVLATVEERRRVAREIHDGIAQELASLGYLIDALIAEAVDPEADLRTSLTGVRRELTRLVNELRLSIFELHTEVDRYEGFGTALAEHVRNVGRDAGLTVHLSLDEQPGRLAAEVEAELLRIAQEALANARKHAGATNLWVDCVIAPPSARLVIEDDGSGISDQRSRGSFGLEIMRERASRLRAELSIGPRQPTGTRVEVTLGGATPSTASSLPPSHNGSSVPEEEACRRRSSSSTTMS
jgi:signal transduction histidine kinase